MEPVESNQRLAFLKLKEAITKRLAGADWAKLLEFFSVPPIAQQNEATIWDTLHRSGSFTPTDVQSMRLVLSELRVDPRLLEAMDEYSSKYCLPQPPVKRYVLVLCMSLMLLAGVVI